MPSVAPSDFCRLQWAPLPLIRAALFGALWAVMVVPESPRNMGSDGRSVEGATSNEVQGIYSPAETVQRDNGREAVLRPRAPGHEAVDPPPVAEGESLRLERCHVVEEGV